MNIRLSLLIVAGAMTTACGQVGETSSASSVPTSSALSQLDALSGSTVTVHFDIVNLAALQTPTADVDGLGEVSGNNATVNNLALNVSFDPAIDVTGSCLQTAERAQADNRQLDVDGSATIQIPSSDPNAPEEMLQTYITFTSITACTESNLAAVSPGFPAPVSGGTGSIAPPTIGGSGSKGPQFQK